MTYEEARERFKKRGSFCDYYTDACDGECEKCSDMESRILEALEKQIPKKPIEDAEYVGWLIWRCPACGAEVGRVLEPLQHHCECGQAIDWGEVE